MKKLIFTLIVTTSVVGGVVTFTTPYDEPAKAKAAVGIDPVGLMSHAVNLPVAHYDITPSCSIKRLDSGKVPSSLLFDLAMLKSPLTPRQKTPTS